MTAPKINTAKTHIVTKFFTPLAVLLTASGILLAWPRSPIREILMALLVGTVAFNFWSIGWIDRDPVPWKLTLRMDLNLLANIAFVYFLGGQWSPIWLLLFLSPLASALYGSQDKVVWQSFFSATILLFLHYVRGLESPMQWAEQITYAISIVLLSLTIYELSRAAKTA